LMYVSVVSQCDDFVD